MAQKSPGADQPEVPLGASSQSRQEDEVSQCDAQSLAESLSEPAVRSYVQAHAEHRLATDWTSNRSNSFHEDSPVPRRPGDSQQSKTEPLEPGIRLPAPPPTQLPTIEATPREGTPRDSGAEVGGTRTSVLSTESEEYSIKGSASFDSKAAKRDSNFLRRARVSVWEQTRWKAYAATRASTTSINSFVKTQSIRKTKIATLIKQHTFKMRNRLSSKFNRQTKDKHAARTAQGKRQSIIARMQNKVSRKKEEPKALDDEEGTEEEGQEEDKEEKGASQFRIPVPAADLRILVKELEAEEEAQIWARFDSFFGFWLVLNGIMISVQTDHRSMFSENTWMLIENAFLVLFCVELGGRFYKAGAPLLKQGWTWFDIIIISVSILDNFVLSQLDMDMGGAGGLAMGMRIIRLFRLARLIKLFRMLKDLWMLTCGLLASMSTLYWSVILLSIFLYIGAVLMRELVGNTVDVYQDVVLKKYESIPTSMFHLLQMTTFDSWADLVSELVEEQAVLAIFFFLFLTVTSLNILNLIVGIMCQSAMNVQAKDRRLTFVKQAVQKQKSLLELRSAMLKKQHALFGQKVDWTLDEMKFEATVDPYLKLCLKTGGIESREWNLMYDSLARDEKGGGKAMRVDFIVQALMDVNGDITERTVDLFTVQYLVRRIHNDFINMHHDLCKLLLDFHIALKDLPCWQILNQQTSPEEVSHLEHWERQMAKYVLKAMYEKLPIGLDGEVFMPLSDYQLEMEGAPAKPIAEGGGEGGDSGGDMEEVAEKLFGKFDSFFGVFLITNGILIGVEVDDPVANTDNYMFWWVLDIFFTILFTSEFVMRVIMWSQIFIDGDVRMWWLFFPNSVADKSRAELTMIFMKNVRTVVQEPFAFFDMCMVLLSLVNNLVIKWFESDMDLSLLTCLRLVRLLKVARIARTFKFCAELFLLVQGVYSSLQTLFWTVMLLVILLYVVGVAMTQLVGRAEAGLTDEIPAEERNPVLGWHYGTVDSSMITLAQIATLDGWADIVFELYDGRGPMMMIVLFFLVIAAFGIMNIVVGIMCESAMAVTRSLNDNEKRKQEVKMQAGISNIRKYYSSRHPPIRERITRKQLMDSLEVPKVEKNYRQAKLDPSQVRGIFDRLSGGTKRDDEVLDLNMLLGSCLDFNEDLKNRDIVALKMFTGATAIRFSETLSCLKYFTKDMGKIVDEFQVVSQGKHESRAGILDSTEVDCNSKVQKLLEVWSEGDLDDVTLVQFKKVAEIEIAKLDHEAQNVALQHLSNTVPRSFKARSWSSYL